MKPHLNRRGAVTIEMTLVGIPLIFVLLITFEIARGMWMYETLAHAVKQGVRLAIVHGQNCNPGPPLNNNCPTTLGNIATEIANNGAGLDRDITYLTFIVVSGTGQTCKLADCMKNTTRWPPADANGARTEIEIDIVTPFHSALAGFWPGTTPQSFALTNFGASSRDRIQF